MMSQGTGREALLVLDAALNVRAANRAFYEMFRLAPEESVGRKVYELGGRNWNDKLRPMLETVEAADMRRAAERAGALTKKLLLTSRRALPQRTGLDRGGPWLPLPGSPLKESSDEIATRHSSEKTAGRVRRLKTNAPTGKE